MARTRNTNLLSNAYNKGGYNPGFTDIFTATTKGMGSVNQKQPKNNTYEDRVIDSEIKNFNQAIDFDYDKVPPELLDQVKQHVNTMSKERGNLGLISSQMDSSDLTKIDLDQNRDMIDSGIAKLGGEFATLKQLRKGWKDDNDNNSISKMVSNEDKLKIHAILNNKLPMSFTPDGRIMFGEGDEAFGLDEMPSYYNKDSVSAGKMLTNYTTVFDENRKLKNDDGSYNHWGNLYHNQFQTMLQDGGDQSLLSLAFDDVGLETRDGGLLGNKEDWQTQLDAINGDDPLAADAAREELRNALTEQYMNTLNRQAVEGVKHQKILDDKNKNKNIATIEPWHTDLDTYVTNLPTGTIPNANDWRINAQNSDYTIIHPEEKIKVEVFKKNGDPHDPPQFKEEWQVNTSKIQLRPKKGGSTLATDDASLTFGINEVEKIAKALKIKY